MVRKQDRQLETHLRSAALRLACLDAGLRSPIRYKAENQKEPSELMWSHKDGRLSVYVNPGRGFSIEDVPYNEVAGENIATIDEVVEILAKHSFLWDPAYDHSEIAKANTATNEKLDADGFPTV